MSTTTDQPTKPKSSPRQSSPRQSSPRRIAASRANGTLAKGPTTPAGLQRSSQNARRHGILSAATVLDDEKPRQFKRFLQRQIECFQPTTDFQLACVEEMAHLGWRIRRLRGIEKALFNRATAKSIEDLDAVRVADAFRSMSGGSALPLLMRYESSLNRMYNRAVKSLEAAQAASEINHLPVADSSQERELQLENGICETNLP